MTAAIANSENIGTTTMVAIPALLFGGMRAMAS